MSLSATIALTESTVPSGRTVWAIVTVTNGGSDSVNITSMAPRTSGGSAEALPVAITPETVLQVTGSNGTQKYAFPVVCYGTVQDGDPNATSTVSVQITIYADDSSVTTSTNTPSIQVWSPTTFVGVPNGGLRFDALLQSGLLAAL